MTQPPKNDPHTDGYKNDHVAEREMGEMHRQADFDKINLPIDVPDLIDNPISSTPSRPKDHKSGHRARLRERFIKGGIDGVQDYELLELILFRAIPRKDVKPLAKEMIQIFGSFADVIAAPVARLTEIKGVSENVATEIKVIQAAALKFQGDNILNRPVLSSWADLLAYCRSAMAYEKIEQFRVLFLDNKSKLMADEQLQKGTVAHTPVYPRQVIKRALELDASAIILVHNHPSGDPTPSPADIKVTNEIYKAAKAMSINLHDHLIIGRDRHLSFKELGLL